MNNFQVIHLLYPTKIYNFTCQTKEIELNFSYFIKIRYIESSSIKKRKNR